jgi:hypothetical protein
MKKAAIATSGIVGFTKESPVPDRSYIRLKIYDFFLSAMVASVSFPDL